VRNLGSLALEFLSGGCDEGTTTSSMSSSNLLSVLLMGAEARSARASTSMVAGGDMSTDEAASTQIVDSSPALELLSFGVKSRGDTSGEME
jgi:hypothetical protein